VPKKLNPFERAARLADEFIDAFERLDGSKRAENKLALRRDKLVVALMDTVTPAPEEEDDGEAATTARVAPAQV
jgi:hypothetical protein